MDVDGTSSVSAGEHTSGQGPDQRGDRASVGNGFRSGERVEVLRGHTDANAIPDAGQSVSEHEESPFVDAAPMAAIAPATRSDRGWMIALHIVPALLLAASISSGGVLAPLPLAGAWMLWMIVRKKSVLIDDHGRESLNFQITLLVYAGVVLVVGLPTVCTGWIIGFPLLAVLALVGCILATRAAVLARPYRYPMTLRFINPAL